MVNLRQAQKTIERQQQQLQASRDQVSRQQEQVRRQQQQLRTRAARSQVTSLSARSARRQQEQRVSGQRQQLQSSQQQISKSQQQLQTQQRQVQRAIAQQERQAAIQKAIQNSLRGRKTDLSKFSAADRRRIQNISSQLEASGRTQGAISRQRQSREISQAGGFSAASASDLGFTPATPLQSFTTSRTSSPSFLKSFKGDRSFPITTQAAVGGAFTPLPISQTRLSNKEFKKLQQEISRKEIDTFVGNKNLNTFGISDSSLSKAAKSNVLTIEGKFFKKITAPLPGRGTTRRGGATSTDTVQIDTKPFTLSGSGTLQLTNRQKTFFERAGVDINKESKILKKDIELAQTAFNSGAITETEFLEQIRKSENKFKNTRFIKDLPKTAGTIAAIIAISAAFPPAGAAIASTTIAGGSAFALFNRKKIIEEAKRNPVGAGLNAAVLLGTGKLAGRGLRTNRVKISRGRIAGPVVGKQKSLFRKAAVDNFEKNQKTAFEQGTIKNTNSFMYKTEDGKQYAIYEFKTLKSGGTKGIKKGEINIVAVEVIGKGGSLRATGNRALGRGVTTVRDGKSEAFVRVINIDRKSRRAAVVDVLEKSKTVGKQGRVTTIESVARIKDPKIIKIKRGSELRSAIKTVESQFKKGGAEAVKSNDFKRLVNLERRASKKRPFTKKEFDNAFGDFVSASKIRTVLQRGDIVIKSKQTDSSFVDFGSVKVRATTSGFTIGGFRALQKKVPSPISVKKKTPGVSKRVFVKEFRKQKKAREASQVLLVKPKSQPKKPFQTQFKSATKQTIKSAQRPQAPSQAGRIAAGLRVKSKSRLTIITKFPAALKSGVTLKSVSLLKTTPTQRTKARTTQNTRTSTLTLLTPSLSTRTRTTTSTGVTTATTPLIRTPIRINVPVLFPLLGSKKTQRNIVRFSNNKQGYAALYKTKGKFKKINKKPLKYNQAQNLGADVVDHTLANTFKVRKVKGRPQKPNFKLKSQYFPKTQNKFRAFRIVKGKKVPLRNTWIEKRGKARLDTFSERKRISTAAYLARLRKKRRFSK